MKSIKLMVDVLSNLYANLTYMFFGISIFVSLSNPHRLGRKGSKSIVQPLGGLGLESLLVVRRSELKSVSVFLVERLHWELLLIVLEKSSKLKVIFGVEV
jgi:hypothetical protein